MAKIVNEKTVYQTRWITVKDLEIEFPNAVQHFQIVEKNDSVMMVPVTSDGKLIFIREYFAAVDEHLLTFPKGRRELNEEPETTIIRELQEEAGYKPDKIKLLSSLLVSPGYLRQKTFVYLCTDLTKSKLQGDEGEQPEVKTFTFSQTEELIKKGKIREARVIAAFFLAGYKLHYDR